MDKQPHSVDGIGRFGDGIFRFFFLRIGNIHLAGHLTLEAFKLAQVKSSPAKEQATVSALQAAARELMEHHYRRVFHNQDWADPADARRVHVRLSPCWTEPSADAPSHDPASSSRAHRIHELASHSSRLSEEERHCFLRKFFLNKTFNEIALETEIPPERVKLHIQAAIKTIREELDQSEEGP